VNLSLKVSDILELFPDAEIIGSPVDHAIKGIASLLKAKAGDLSFLGNKKYKGQVASSQASLILVPTDYLGTPFDNQFYLKLLNPSDGLAKICRLIEEKLPSSFHKGVHSTAFIESTAKVHSTASIGAFTYVGNEVEIGPHCRLNSHCHIGTGSVINENCTLHPGVKLLARCELGRNVILNAGVVIGSEGYGFEKNESGHEKIPHLGRVIVEDDVEIGANTCIDRARFENTVIGQGSKIDNLVQIGHNVRIGQNCLIVAQVGISGSVTLEDDVIVGGQAGFAGHLTVGKGAKIAGQAGITKDVEPGAFLKGNPALPFHLAQRISVLQRKLPELFNRFAQENSSD
jgi:UDP-3-O-[3-hydroxymyristoyl] glucosamine N-acyltransferase